PAPPPSSPPPDSAGRPSPPPRPPIPNGRRLPASGRSTARLRPDARRVALVVTQPADAARPDAGRGDRDAPDRRDPEERRAGTERGVRSGQQGLQLLPPQRRGARAHPVRRPWQLRPRLR